jgi:hypothetical protein
MTEQQNPENLPEHSSGAQPAPRVESSNGHQSPEAEFLATMPPEIREKYAQFMSLEVMGQVSPSSSLINKMQPEHIGKLLDNLDKDGERELKKGNTILRFAVIFVLIGCGILVFLTLTLKDQPDLLRMAITAIISGGMSFAGGYGVGISRGKRQQ